MTAAGMGGNEETCDDGLPMKRNCGLGEQFLLWLLELIYFSGDSQVAFCSSMTSGVNS